MNEDNKKSLVLTGVAILFFSLAAVFMVTAAGRDRAEPRILLVDPEFLDKSPVRMNHAALVAAGEDTSDYDCYLCHSRSEPVELNFDALGKLIIKEHDYITFAHGPARENHLCFNCHMPEQMDHLRTQYGRKLTFDQSSEMCGSCHGTTYRDWKADAHGRTSGYWNLAMGERTRLDCTECHDPHNTRFPAIAPAPGPHSMKGRILVEPESGKEN